MSSPSATPPVVSYPPPLHDALPIFAGLVKDGNTAPGGSFPMNTNGGGLSFNHSGMYGMQLLVEAYRQLSGTAEDGIHGLDRKSTRLNSSHLVISYAVFCLKKKIKRK